MAKSPAHSAGIALNRLTGTEPELLLLHPGGPFWAKKDAGAWSMPKGLIEASETPLADARREFAEKLGLLPPERKMMRSAISACATRRAE